MILQVLSVSPSDPYSFQFIQTEPTHGLTGVYTIVNSFISPVSLSIPNTNTTKTICQEKTLTIHFIICSNNRVIHCVVLPMFLHMICQEKTFS